MASQAVAIASRSFSYILQLWDTIMESTGLKPFFITMFTILVIVLYLLSAYLIPIPSGGSDTANKPKTRGYVKGPNPGRGGTSNSSNGVRYSNRSHY